MTGDTRIEAYLSQVATALPGPARARDDIIAELRSGLLDAADAYRAAGHTPGEAAAAAAAEFGDPHQVAAAFRPELATRQARRLARTLITTGPLIGLLWVAAAMASHIAIYRAPPWHWHGMPPVAPIAVPVFGAFFLTFVCAAGLTLAATGPLARWLPASQRAAPVAAIAAPVASIAGAVAGYAAAAADLAILSLLASKLVSAPATLAPVCLFAAAASLTRLTLARRAASHCLTARAPYIQRR